MYRLGHVHRLLLSTAVALLAATGPLAVTDRILAGSLLATQDNTREQAQGTVVTLRWGAREGALRYRLQLANDARFTDIVFDRVVNGTSYEITDLPPGRYFWRVAALTTKLIEFSSAQAVNITDAQPATKTDRQLIKKPARTESFVTADGWRAAIGDAQSLVLAHLRATSRSEIVAINSSGVTYALDATSGIALWVAPPLKAAAPNATAPVIAPLVIESPGGVNRVIVLAGSSVRCFEGATGRELWHTTIPAIAATASGLNDRRSAAVFVVDSSFRNLVIVNTNDGSVSTRIQLPGRVSGPPVTFDFQGRRVLAFAYENGLVEIRDQSAQVIRSGNTASTNTTPPVFAKGPRGDLMLVGTKSGLTALDSADLRPLGRVTLQDDAPRGIAVADLDSNASPEVIMLTQRGRVAAVQALDGKIIWQSEAIDRAEGVTFADIDRDGVIDVIVTGRQPFASVLSGRDGSVLWKTGDASVGGKQTSTGAARSIIAFPVNSGTLLIASDASGVYAVEIHKDQNR